MTEKTRIYSRCVLGNKKNEAEQRRLRRTRKKRRRNLDVKEGGRISSS